MAERRGGGRSCEPAGKRAIPGVRSSKPPRSTFVSEEALFCWRRFRRRACSRSSDLYLIVISDKSMHTERDVELALKLPVLALVPVLEVLTQGKSKVSETQPRLGEIGTRA